MGNSPTLLELFNDVLAGEILPHRVVWSFVFMGILVTIQRRWGDMKRIVANRSLLLSLTVSGLLIAANWLIFIWAVNNSHVVETSLGYYLNPLLNELLAVVFLHEKPNRGQWLAIAIAGAAVLIIAIDYGRFPWISISLAVTFGLYGVAKKKIGQDASVGLLSETAVILPVALGDRMDATCIHIRRAASFRRGNSATAALLCASGCPNGTVHARFRSIHRADDHAVTECIRIQGIGLTRASYRLRAHLDSACRIRYGISTGSETCESTLTEYTSTHQVPS